MLTPFKRLWNDERGNALAITAAITIPLLGLIGSGVDLSRAYLAKNRLQQACDAGVLAGRKVMAGTVDTAVTDEVRKYVNYNFPQGTMRTDTFPIDPIEGDEKSVDLTLATRIDTAVMKLFGIESLAVEASCRGRQDFVNTDVMMVLDTTLSMNCAPSDGATTYCTSEKSNAKIKALRGAVIEFYKSLKNAQTRLEANGLRLRYGVVPYSMTVNTGKLLYAKNTAYIRNPARYQQCSGSGCSTVNNNNVTHTTSWFTSTWGGCIEERQTVTTIRYSTGYTVPSGASDLDIDSAPTSDATKWAPYDPAAATAKSGSAGIDQACPKEARPLAAFATESAFNTWLSTMTAGGYTYHDIGLIWGARMFSPTGLWSADNPNSFNSFPVNRHLIFMTDGVMDPDLNAYTAYGVETYSSGGRRVTGNGNSSTQLESHTQRFRMMCNKIKGMDIQLWVVAFGTSAGTGLSTELQNCASNPNMAFKVNDQASLNAKFKEIGESIGALRLSQ